VYLGDAEFFHCSDDGGYNDDGDDPPKDTIIKQEAKPLV
jgi:hypothetical protein